jgi:cell division protein FtsI/penicillin-binding protein 2
MLQVLLWILEQLKKGKPVLCEVPEKINCNGIICTEVYGDFSEQIPAIHMVGYTDSELKGVTGITAAYDDFLYSDSEIYVAYECSGKGDILEGTAPLLVNDTSIESGGVVTTIDINIQNIAENAADFIEVGAIVITEAKNGGWPNARVVKASQYKSVIYI